ncbi:cadmium resistance transporter [Loigolactobacillus iwatensis]|uniref:cadmium resistance transporter n=1 Tax=Loigolactobacillus iwatensis TaxID=1267156 RepID=UPI000F7E1118|nr:cadmium resistance transporter [Loigolactobacillus iwatensis]
MLGLLSLIPIIMGLNLLLSGVDDNADVVNEKLSNQRELILNVAVITISTCGADNIGIYVHFFVTLSASVVIVVLLTFLAMLVLFCLAGPLFAAT